jgi:pimeloyl-ACP methyl ester carboxylesterase
MHSSFVSFKSSLVHYSFSDGHSNPVICFHGYGESEFSFHFLEKKIAKDCVLIAIDMPYHGKTDWKEGLEFTISDVITIVHAILKQRGFATPVFTLLAYSMGGRIALSLLQQLPAQVRTVILVAPDGLKVNFWYWFSTQTWAGNKLFLATVNHPQWFLGFLKLANKAGLLNRSIYKFVGYFLNDRDKREELYRRWTCFRKLRPQLTVIKTLIRQHKIATHLIYGLHDRIILPSRGEKFRNGIEEFCSIDILESGHQLLQEKNAAALLQYLPH